jgi:secreted PhoX family phosphatase
VLRWKDGQLLDHRVSISGTSSNCAGGPSPWRTWLTCEEGTDHGAYPGAKPHGYVFECTINRVTNPTPLTAMGRFSHEAIAFDPVTGYVYETEDNSSPGTGDPAGRNRGRSGFYRFIPELPLGDVGSLALGGSLYMLKAIGPGGPVDDLRDPECFATYDVEWVPIATPDSPPVGGASGPYLQGRAQGATRFQRLEGCWWDPVNELVYFVDTEGGPIGADAGRTDRAEGAVWAYDPRENKLTCVFVSQGALAPDAYGADNPDNVHVSPRGGVILCEDGDQDDGNGLSMLGLLPNGQTFEFARNIINISPSDAAALIAAGHNPAAIGTGDFSDNEWAGATFDPTGRFLFANIQTPGITFAITGPWKKGPF